MEASYAQALWNIIQKGTSAETALKEFDATLTAAGRKNLWPKIAFAFRRLAEREATKSTLVLTIADSKHEAQSLKDARDAIAKLGLDASKIAVNIDTSLIGGWRLEGQEVLLDASYKKDLLTIYQAATKH